MEGALESTANGTKRDLLASLSLGVVLIASLSLNVWLGWRVRNMERAVRSPEPRAAKLAPGAMVPSIAVRDLDGNQALISYSGYATTVLYVFTPSCHWCARNLANIQTLSRVKGKTFRFVGISLARNGTKEYVERSSLAFPVYTDLAPNAISALGLGGTPQTLVVSSDGHLLRNWSGAYGDDLGMEVSRYFDLELPGLLEDEE